MSKAARWGATRVMAVGKTTVDYDARKSRARSRAPMGKLQFELWKGYEWADVPHFYLTMEEHLAEITQLHNAKLEHKRRSPEHAALRIRMHDSVRLVIGDAPFARFVPGRVGNEMLSINSEDIFTRDVVWASYWPVDAIDQLARELYHDAAMLIGNYHQALFNWQQLVKAHGVEAVNALLAAREAA
ncbi:hypothetical protein ACSFBF_10215 [Variovorax sp. ZT5P49]|uniref:hypothetical protein n=1 Tax=Variovorax sp. ZT5P49 TaxID=3443733 RepID=UPI003F4683CF